VGKEKDLQVMEFMQLEMFVAIVEEHSVRDAAERVRRSQPAVSMAVRKLENEIGVRLFETSGRTRYELTEAGETLYAYASRILKLRSEASSAIRELHEPNTGSLHIGGTESLSIYLLPKFAQSFLEQHPGVPVELMCERSDKLLQGLKNRRLDLAFVPFRPRDVDLESEFVARDELVFIANPAHPLAARKRIEIKDLGAESLLITSDSQPHPWHKRVADTFSRLETPFNSAMTNAPIETIKRIVSAGMTIGLAPLMCVQEEKVRGQLAVLEVEGFHQGRSVHLVGRKEHRSRVSKIFVELVRAFVREQVTAGTVDLAH
jgi:DNA-binding transcriptional LysR family regulator